MGPTTLYINNHAADLLARNLVNHSATKHIDMHYHYIHECITDGSVALHFIGSNNMAADILTKPLGWTKHDHFCLMLGMEFLE